MKRSLVIVGAGRTIEADVASPSELATLSRSFVEEAAALRKICGEGFGFNANVTFGNDPRGKIELSDEVRGLAAVLALRPFVLEQEALFVPKYLGAFKRHNRDDAPVWAADFMVTSFLLGHAGFALSVDAGRLDLETQWRNYVYAHHYHRNADKRAKLDAAFAAMPTMAPVTFWWGVVTKVNVVFQLQAFAAMLAGDEPVFVLNLGGTGAVEDP